MANIPTAQELEDTVAPPLLGVLTSCLLARPVYRALRALLEYCTGHASLSIPPSEHPAPVDLCRKTGPEGVAQCQVRVSGEKKMATAAPATRRSTGCWCWGMFEVHRKEMQYTTRATHDDTRTVRTLPRR